MIKTLAIGARIDDGARVVSTHSMYRGFGAGRVLKVKNEIAKVEFSPGLFSKPPLYAHTKLLRLGEIERVPSPLELAVKGQWDEPWRFDLRQMAARFLTANKGGQLSNARTELLPHQIFAAHKVVSSARRRFLLADEVGLGKTIEAGMIWQALEQRDQAKRTLIICPAGLTVQWQEEMLDKFEQFFEVFGRDFHTINPRIWDLKECAIASLDCLKRPEHKAKLLENRRWDLIVFDEAHRLSARDYWGETEKTQNYRLAEDLKDHTDALLLMTATPHQGDENNSRFVNLVGLLDDDIDFSALEARDMPLFAVREKSGTPFAEYILRTPKLNVTDAEGKRVFRGRNTYPLSFPMFADEARFYEAVNAYIRTGYGALDKVRDRSRRLALGFVLTIFQKLAASSTRAIKAALLARKLRLRERQSRAGKEVPGEPGDERYLGEWEEERVQALAEGEVIEDEIGTLERLIELPVDRDRKLRELLSLVAQIFEESEKGDKEKVLVFTEYRRTQEYLVENLQEEFGQDAVVVINGDMKLDARKEAQNAFRNHEAVRFLISTEAGGEGINLQFCHVLVNYDLPWNPMRIEQRVGRIYRFGQRKVVQIYNFMNKQTVEDKVYTYIERRLDRAAQAMCEVTGESHEDIKAAMLGQMDGDVDYTQIYKRTLVEGTMRQSKKEIDQGIERARKAYEIATESLFRDVSAYTFDRYHKSLRSGVDLSEMEVFAETYLKAHRRRLARRDGLLEFVTPDELADGEVQERYVRATFDREKAIRDNSLEFLALGHPFVDAMMRSCGDLAFRGRTAVRKLIVPGAIRKSGAQFNFVIRHRLQREDGEECLFDLATVFVTVQGGIDEGAAAICRENYACTPATDISPPAGFDFEHACRTAREYLEQRIPDIWDWDEEAELLNLAWVRIEAD